MRETSATDTHRLQWELIVPTSPEQLYFRSIVLASIQLSIFHVLDPHHSFYSAE